MQTSQISIPVLDAHNDTLILHEILGESMDFSLPAPGCHVDLARMKQGRIQGAFVMVGDKDLNQSSRLIDAVYRMEANHPDDFSLCHTRKAVEQAFIQGKFAIIMSIESQTMFAGNIDLFCNWIRLGVRVASLTHGEGRKTNPHAVQEDDSFHGFVSKSERDDWRKTSKGLTGFAREALDVMAEYHILCDVAHVNDKAFWEVLDYAKSPVSYTHGNCYSLCPHARNLTDEMMRALADKGGIMGLAVYGKFVDREAPTVDRLADHVIHALDIMGSDHVGIGSDFDGMTDPVIQDASHMGELWTILRKRGVEEKILNKIGYQNFLSLL